MTSQLTIGMTGPTSSGKTALIRAFIWSISQMEKRDDIRHSIVDGQSVMRIELKRFFESSTLGGDDELYSVDEDQLYLDSELNVLKGTETVQREGYRISRTRRAGQQSPIINRRIELSQSSYDLVLNDTKGKDNVDNDTTTFSYFKNLPAMMLIIDPNKIEDEKDQDELVSNLKNLCRLESQITLTSNDSKAHTYTRHIAICVNKYDEIVSKAVGLSPKDYVLNHATPALHNELTKIEHKFVVQYFYTSAWGFYNNLDNGRRGPNVASNQYKDREHWVPFRVTAPFFWLFEEFEKERIENIWRFLNPIKKAMNPIEAYQRMYIPFNPPAQ